VTEKRFMENTLQEYAVQLERSNKELEQFAFVASHDLQEPLRKVKVFSELLMEKTLDKLDGDERDYLSRMQHAVLRMQTMIRDLLAYSRVTTKGQPFNPVELNQVAEEVLYDLDIRISRSQAVVEVGDLPVIEADPMQMRQLFQNLISNALKFHQKDVLPRVRIYSRPGEVSGMIQLVFEDNGIGFDLEHLDRIFQPFERLHGMSRFEGTGMGLAICAKIVQRHHGKIDADSQPGEGATFFVSLPLHQPVTHTDHELVKE
jgi:light-regulated signal transduction histidine kinase (bacteriophytochrome)